VCTTVPFLGPPDGETDMEADVRFQCISMGSSDLTLQLSSYPLHQEMACFLGSVRLLSYGRSAFQQASSHQGMYLDVTHRTPTANSTIVRTGHHNSKCAFQTQFKRWDFPSKQSPAYKNVTLVQHVKELWDSNTSQREMLRTLNEEGFDIKERELIRVQAKNR
jgi:hypothetical protein